MALLNETYQNLLDTLEQEGLRKKKKLLDRDLAPLLLRKGLQSPAISQLMGEYQTDLAGQLQGTRANLAVDQLKREQQLSDVSEARKFSEKEWLERYKQNVKLSNLQYGQQKELQTTQRQYDIQDRQYQEKMLKELQDKIEKDNRKSWYKNLIGTGLNIATGGIAGAIGGLGQGIGGLKGGLLGGLMGGKGVAGIYAQNQMLQPFLQRNNTMLNNMTNQGTSPLSQALKFDSGSNLGIFGGGNRTDLTAYNPLLRNRLGFTGRIG